jgi:hypothetical protein
MTERVDNGDRFLPTPLTFKMVSPQSRNGAGAGSDVKELGKPSITCLSQSMVSRGMDRWIEKASMKEAAASVHPRRRGSIWSAVISGLKC